MRLRGSLLLSELCRNWVFLFEYVAGSLGKGKDQGAYEELRPDPEYI
jgi:hypothetical protein